MHVVFAQFICACVAALAIWMSVRVANGRRPSRRTVFGSLCGLGILLGGWLGIAEYQYRRQMRVIGMVERLGGSVVATSDAPRWILRLRPDDKIRAGTGLGPNWFRKLLPFNRITGYSLVVTQVWLDNCNGFHPYSDFSGERGKVREAEDWNGIKPTAQDLAQLAKFTHLKLLHLGETEIGDAEIAAIRDIRGLRELWLGETEITDASLDLIAGFEELEKLGLHGTKITDRGLLKLAGLKRLREVHVFSTDVTEEGCAAFRAHSPCDVVWPSPR